MMRVVNFLHEIHCRELQLMHPEPPRLALGRETMPRTEIKKDVCRLRDDQPASLQKRRSVRRRLRALHQPHHLADAVLAACDVDIIRLALLQRETNEFATALDAR